MAAPQGKFFGFIPTPPQHFLKFLSSFQHMAHQSFLSFFFFTWCTPQGKLMGPCQPLLTKTYVSVTQLQIMLRLTSNQKKNVKNNQVSPISSLALELKTEPSSLWVCLHSFTYVKRLSMNMFLCTDHMRVHFGMKMVCKWNHFQIKIITTFQVWNCYRPHTSKRHQCSCLQRVMESKPSIFGSSMGPKLQSKPFTFLLLN